MRLMAAGTAHGPLLLRIAAIDSGTNRVQRSGMAHGVAGSQIEWLQTDEVTGGQPYNTAKDRYPTCILIRFGFSIGRMTF
jgi:hypothetical protein